MDISVIKSYLVELGFKVDNRQANLFNEGLKKAAIIAGEATGKIAKSFLIAGATVTGVLTTIAAGTIGMMAHVADADLEMQMLARRLFLSTDAARKMKTATDALGVSIEEIVWGPPELAERYKVLISDQNRMLKALGGADFEKQMRNLRDVRFEFTRLGVEMKYFSMLLVTDLSKALFGDENALLAKLRKFSDWFMGNMPRIASAIATEVAPAFHEMGAAAAHLWETLSKVDWATLLSDVVKITTALIKMLDFIVSHPSIMKILGLTASGAAIGSIIPGVGTALGAGAGFAAGIGSQLPSLMPQSWQDWINGKGKQTPAGKLDTATIQKQIVGAAVAAGIDPALALAVSRQESNFNPNALNRSSGAMGLFQLMPGTAKQMHVENPYDAAQNINAGVQLLHDMLARHGGDTSAALKDFGGFIHQDPTDYINSVERYRKQFASSATGIQPISTSRLDVGGVNVYITEPNATPEQIHGAVVKSVDEALTKKAQFLLAQRQGVYA